MGVNRPARVIAVMIFAVGACAPQVGPQRGVATTRTSSTAGPSSPSTPPERRHHRDCPKLKEGRSRRALARLPEGWSSLAPPPIKRARAVSVWVDGALFFWGGDSNYGGTVHEEGALYDPRKDEWHRVPASPISGRSSPGAAWTGTEVIIWGGWGPGEQSNMFDGAAFTPRTCRWRLLPPAPMEDGDPVATVWTGEEVIFWGSATRPDGGSSGGAYSPAEDEWREIADAPIALTSGDGVWTGDEMIVFGSRLDNNNHSATNTAIGAAYDPERDSWRKLPGVALSPQASAVAWTGHEMVAWDYELTASAYVPRTDRWRDIDDVPLEFSECYPANAATQSHLFAYFCGAAASLDLDSWQWRRAARTVAYGAPVAAGSVFLLAGAAHENVRNRLMAFNPGR